MNQDQLARESMELARRQTEMQGRTAAARPFLEGEDPSSPHPDDARHWSAVYGELVDFKTMLLAEVEKEAHAAGHSVAEELEHDRALLAIELQRLNLHLRFWTDRLP